MPPEDSRSAENSTGVLEAVSQLEMYKLARAQVEHENTLVGQRITWFLTFQGLMLTAFFVAIGLLGKEKTQFSELARANISVAVLLLAAIGFMSCIACFLLVRAAYAQINVVEEWWRAHSIPKSAFPDIILQVKLTDCLRILAFCKLYDYHQHRWLDYDGKPMSD